MGKKMTSKEKRLAQIRKELASGWPPSNPKAASARFRVVVEFARLTGQRLQDVIKKLQRGESIEPD